MYVSYKYGLEKLVKGFWCCDNYQTESLAAMLYVQKRKDISDLDSSGGLIGKEAICSHKCSLVRNPSFEFNIEPERKEMYRVT